MAKYQTVVRTVDGETWISDPGTEDISDKELKEIAEITSKVKHLDLFSLLVDGNTLFFNPDNIIYVKIKEVKE